MIIESFGILCIVTITGCINYSYYRIFKNEYETIKYNNKNKVNKQIIDKSIQKKAELKGDVDNNLLEFKIEDELNNNNSINSKLLYNINSIDKSILINNDIDYNDNVDNDNDDSFSIYSSDSFSTFSTIDSISSYVKEL